MSSRKLFILSRPYRLLQRVPRSWSLSKENEDSEPGPLQQIDKADSDPAAFRPICLQDAMGKILDKLITHRIFFHLLRNNHLSDRQYGFSPGRSAQDAILQLKSWIATARSRDNHSVIVSLDVKSAFSRVWWPLVLQNLKSKNCPRNLFRVISTFLDDRKISISYSDSSITHDYEIVCPQGYK
ncbi:hypothetical protein AVEN_271436-1 [Araneus ventricosus]|uniref:Reverse transcriptase domain-containing protein n=1 Tax=Araneus ventricosus TaxID=182803 RepID=A0A4Y2R3Q1_ARAVE|nr:hypothetical protein AVEN_271436-1 [Araneus ventricosus]